MYITLLILKPKSQLHCTTTKPGFGYEGMFCIFFLCVCVCVCIFKDNLWPGLVHISNQSLSFFRGIKSGQELHHSPSELELHQFVNFFSCVSRLTLVDEPDSIAWKLSPSRMYSAKTAYSAQFQGLVRHQHSSLFWNCGVPEKCKFFAWLLVQWRVPTADVLSRKGIQNDKWCPFCLHATETADHIFLSCCFAHRLWSLVAEWSGQSMFRPGVWSGPPAPPLDLWWMNRIDEAKRSLDKHKARNAASLFLLSLWSIWRE